MKKFEFTFYFDLYGDEIIYKTIRDFWDTQNIENFVQNYADDWVAHFGYKYGTFQYVKIKEV